MPLGRVYINLYIRCFNCAYTIFVFTSAVALNRIIGLFIEHSNQTGKLRGSWLAFAFFWVLSFCLYYPAARAGFVTDFTGWLDQVRNHSFSEFINRTHFEAKSLYQLTQFNTWVYYKLVGVSVWAWHLLFLTLHATNVFLLFVVVRRLLADASVNAAGSIAFGGSILCCVSAYNSEVIVWEPSFHFLQGLLLILLILVCVQRYIRNGQSGYVWVALLLYGLSLFSLEIFYITPWLILSLYFFYRFASVRRPFVSDRLFSYLFAPMLLMQALRFVGYRLLYGDWVSRIGSTSLTSFQFSWLGKPAKYLFHLLFLGRFCTDEFRQQVYCYCDAPTGIVIFYTVVVLIAAYSILRFRSMSGKSRVATVLFSWMMMALMLLVPLWFASDMLVLYDRYIYFAGSFFYMLFAVLLSMISFGTVRLIVLSVFAVINLRYAVQVSRYWGKSARVINNLLQSIPNDGGRTILLLNLPQNMHGVAMIGAEKQSEYKLMHDLLLPDKKFSSTVYDVMAYNMLTPDDGAHVNVINDSLIKVTLNQWGTWWWYETRGGYSYATSDYRLDLRDPGRWYEITLKKPASQYLLLYSVGGKWKAVDMNKKGADQN
jgi:hypothetical protein